MNLFILADSISVHYGPYLKEFLGPGWKVQRKGEPEGCGAGDEANPAINGGDSAQVLAYLQSLAGRGLRADWLLLNAGLHDIRRDPDGNLRTSPRQYRANLERGLLEARLFALHTAWVRITPVYDDLHNTRTAEFRRFQADVIDYNGIAGAVMAAAGVPVIDLAAFSLALGREEVCDHVHFTPAARRLQAAFLAGAIQALSGVHAGH